MRSRRISVVKGAGGRARTAASAALHLKSGCWRNGGNAAGAARFRQHAIPRKKKGTAAGPERVDNERIQTALADAEADARAERASRPRSGREMAADAAIENNLTLEYEEDHFIRIKHL